MNHKQLSLFEMHSSTDDLLSKFLSRHEVANRTTAFRFEKPPNCMFEAGQYPDMTTIEKEEHRPFDADAGELSRRALVHMEQGAVTSAHKGDRKTVMRILNKVLATEIVCVLRYKRHYSIATGIHAQTVAEEFLETLGRNKRIADHS